MSKPVPFLIWISGFDIVQDLNREGKYSFTPQKKGGGKVTFVARSTFRHEIKGYPQGVNSQLPLAEFH